jgi:hypothetical protein
MVRTNLKPFFIMPSQPSNGIKLRIKMETKPYSESNNERQN